nr:glutamate receptor ionotropic, delta-2-like [Parasteatoda tepidariorum]
MAVREFLKVAVVEFGSLKLSLTSAGEVEFLGYEGRMLKAILDALHAVPDVVIPLDLEWGSLKKDGNWTGMIGMVHRGEADIAMSLISQSSERMKAVDFSRTYAITDTTFVVKKPGMISKGFVFLLPFSLNIWIICIAFIIIYPLLIRIFLSTNSYMYLWLNTMGNILKQPSEIAHKPWYNRIIQATWLLFAFMISCSYSAVMLSFLTLPIEGELIKSFRQLSEAVINGKFDCYTMKGTLTAWMLLNSEDVHIKKLGELIVRNDWMAQLNLNSSLVLPNGQALNAGSAQINLRAVLEKDFRLRPDMYISQDSMGAMLIAIATNKNFCCRKKLDDILYRLVESENVLFKYAAEASPNVRAYIKK